MKARRVMVSDGEFETVLILLAMVDFDIILGMDCSSVNQAIIDCESRMVNFKLPSWESLVYRGRQLGRP